MLVCKTETWMEHRGRFAYSVEKGCIGMRNAQKIRSMSDEELAKLLCCTGWRMIEQKECLEWLQQPAEEDGHDERKENENV